MTLEIDLSQRLGDFQLDAAFRSQGRLTALFGRSGSGKTSIVNLVAGLSRPDRGRIAAGGAVLADTRARVFVPPHRRRVGYVFQDARLFPHLSVANNLNYGRWFAARRERATPSDFDRVVELLGLAPLLDRRPAGLSGGERQRAAIGRALLGSPRLLLMDEPLAALDEARKAEILPYVERLRDEAAIPIIYVSHSVGEVLRLADAIVVLDAGKVVAEGAPEDTMRRMDLLPAGGEAETGRNLDAVVAGHDEAYALTILGFGANRVVVPRLALSPGTRVRLRVRAADVTLALEAPRGLSALNVLPARVLAARPDGSSGMEVVLACGNAEILSRITRRSFDAMRLAPGISVFAILKSVSFDRQLPGATVAGFEPSSNGRTP